MKTKKLRTHEQKLIDNHIFIEKGKFFFGIFVIIICVILYILSSTGVMRLEGNILGWSIAAAAMIMASSKIKTIKDILSFQ